MKNVIYKDEDYTIIKKGVDEIGHYMPATCLELIGIAIKELKEWKDGGFTKESWKEITDYFIKEMKSVK